LNPSTFSRIGLYGGAFDPPHSGHLALATCAIEQLQLDMLYVVPTGHAWHKSRSLSTAHHRLTMVQLNFASCDKARVDDREIRRAGPSYTVDTLNELKDHHQGATFFIVMGADQALQFQTWRHWQHIAANATLAIAQRTFTSESQSLTDEWHNQHQATIIRLNMPLKKVSATDIRSCIRQGISPAEDLIPSVSKYIQQHHLYLDQHD
jgi:nicotinate-nucleotide adenylyltransferase